MRGFNALLATAVLMCGCPFTTPAAASDAEDLEGHWDAAAAEAIAELEAYDGPVFQRQIKAAEEDARKEAVRAERERLGLSLEKELPSSMAPPGVPTEVEIPDGSGWLLLSDLAWDVGNTGLTLVVPKGFIHDKASVPRPLQWLVKQTGAYSRAAAIHDYLYWQQDCSRKQADRLFLIALKESGVVPKVQQLLYLGVRFGGKAAYLGNKKDRNNGVRRMYVDPLWQEILLEDGTIGLTPDWIPDGINPLNAESTRDSMQAQMRAAAKLRAKEDGDAEFVRRVPDAVCALGDSTEVPI